MAEATRLPLKARIQGGSSGGLWIGTFHSIFARLLRDYIDLIGYNKNFSIFDSEDSKSLIRQAMAELNISAESVPVNTVQGLISRYRSQYLILYSPILYNQGRAPDPST